jgi:preprotein translocase subunit YajC
MKNLGIALLMFSLVSLAFAAEDVVTATHGTITKIDKATKTLAVKTADGTEHVFHWTKDTTVHGVRAADAAAEDSWHGLKEGSEVVAHSAKRGSEDTALEVDKVGDDGMKKTEGTVKEIDRGTRKLVVETADGTEHTFKLTAHAASDSGADVAKGAEKGSKVVVYSTEEAGKRVAHFFENI